MGANKSRPTGVDESDEEEHDSSLTGAGKAIKKLINKREKNDAYESDKEKEDPSVSSAVRLDSSALRNNLTDLVGGGRRGRRACNY